MMNKETARDGICLQMGSGPTGFSQKGHVSLHVATSIVKCLSVFDMFLRARSLPFFRAIELLWKSFGWSRRSAQTVIFPCNMTSKYCRDCGDDESAQQKLRRSNLSSWNSPSRYLIVHNGQSTIWESGFQRVPSEDQIIRETPISGKAAQWPRWDLRCGLLVCSAYCSRLRPLPPRISWYAGLPENYVTQILELYGSLCFRLPPRFPSARERGSAPKGGRLSTIFVDPQWKLCLSSGHLCSGSLMVWQSTPKSGPNLCLWNKNVFSRKPLPCSPAAEAALQPLIWCSES